MVVDIRGDKVRLGVEAPKEVPVHRREVHDAIHRGEREAESKGLESSVDAESPSKAELHQQFRDYLKQGDYLNAYATFTGNSDLPSRDELFQLIHGLRVRLQEYE